MENVSADLRDFLNYPLIHTDSYKLHIFNLVEVVVIFIIARLLLFVLRQFLNRRIKNQILDHRKSYAIRQIVRYMVYTIALVLALDTLGIKITVLIAGSTALFVGLGLGLQDTFKDLVSGIVILIERTVSAGDIVEINGVVGKVADVGLRTTRVMTRDDIMILVPNQKLINDQVINWTQNQVATRFYIDVGVAYGSDTRLVERLLIENAARHTEVLKNPAPHVHFTDFANSSLDFRLFFYCDEMFRIERIKSDIRYSVDQAFRDNGVTIPFPQRDVWLRKND